MQKIHNRKAADLVMQHQVRSAGDRRNRANGDRIAGHDLADRQLVQQGMQFKNAQRRGVRCRGFSNITPRYDTDQSAIVDDR